MIALGAIVVYAGALGVAEGFLAGLQRAVLLAPCGTLRLEMKLSFHPRGPNSKLGYLSSAGAGQHDAGHDLTGTLMWALAAVNGCRRRPLTSRWLVHTDITPIL